MLNNDGEQIYVAELGVPTCFYVSQETRYPLQHPTGFQVNKGYYAIHPRYEQSALDGYAEMALVIEFVSQGIKEAEEHALKVGRMFGSAASAFGGYPLESPYLRRIAHIGIYNDLKSQYNYSYGIKPYTLSQFDYEGGHQFDRYLQSISLADANTRHHIQSAIHWYGISISTDDPAISWVAAWTGLECIGKIIHEQAHPNGPKARCETCGNIPGEDRNRKKAGIDHMFNILSKVPSSASLSEEVRQLLVKDFLWSLSSEDAENLRSWIVHGLEDIETSVQRSSRSRRFLAHVLNAAIQIVLGEHVTSWLPGDYGSHPNARYSLRFKEGFTMSPYHGDWGAKLHTKTQPNIPRPDNPYLVIVEVKLLLNGSAVGFVELQSEELFGRGASVHHVDDHSEVTGLPDWHDRPSDPPWKPWTGAQLN